MESLCRVLLRAVKIVWSLWPFFWAHFPHFRFIYIHRATCQREGCNRCWLFPAHFTHLELLMLKPLLQLSFTPVSCSMCIYNCVCAGSFGLFGGGVSVDATDAEAPPSIATHKSISWVEKCRKCFLLSYKPSRCNVLSKTTTQPRDQ
ncbi:hypothetical protein P154DRAFT_119097 [Amniculicola lignicola CBS 123094]|uniref:Uncharacterized protein n=1 Tax=Amniculicola lignicola CBS 123094 TaxID=1392246 RepID=A0A6A5X3E5_9PLEO|nr:hypothetical protein P154DRAFT_119097 [Amniculicola lignicola CBS 123094]